MVVLSFCIGLILGSFLSALTDRWPKDISIQKGRSMCPICKKQIAWYDNIPLLSYIVLRGKCRNCHAHISLRYPAIELSAALLLSFSVFKMPAITQSLPWLINLPEIVIFTTLIFVVGSFIAVFVIDLEHQYIPDRITFWGLGIIVAAMVVGHFDQLYMYIFAGLSSSLFLLILHLGTKGRGMGLGDVKLALFIGTMFGPHLSLLWMFLSFIIGSVIGIVLLIVGKAKLKKPIPFGPFLIVSAFLVLYWGPQLYNVLLPYSF